MFVKKCKVLATTDAISVSGISPFSLSDTLECGQAFRYELLERREDYCEYLTVVGEKLLKIGEKSDGELIFYDVSGEELYGICIPYFSLDEDYEMIKRDILSRSDSPRLAEAADAADGIRILRQEPWEALFSFIISQNNNIPRIRKIIRNISAQYGKNLSENRTACPKDKSLAPSPERCAACGICYSFPRPEDIVKNPEKLLPSRPGFRYKYLVDAAQKLVSGEVDFDKIKEENSAEFTLAELKKIKGVGDKVASCVALFGFGNLEAFPVDVWVRRANEEYFGGSLEPASLGKYAGVAQQYIFHYIRNLEKNGEK